jgi:hypothetical protein
MPCQGRSNSRTMNKYQQSHAGPYHKMNKNNKNFFLKKTVTENSSKVPL